MADAIRKGNWVTRLTGLAVFLCLGSVLAALVAAIGSGQGWWHFRAGFDMLRYAVYGAGAGVLFALIALVAGRKARSRLYLANLAGLVVAAGFLLFIGNLVRTAKSVPAIHDITTNLEDPPRFYRLHIRADNLENVPAEGRPDLERLPPEERWRSLHREHYGDLTTLRLATDVSETIRRARALAADRGWDIVSADEQGGVLEAVDTSLFFRFKDDIVVRARPAEGGGSLVDMRSISRVGVSDVGVNARRVREFLAELQSG